MDPRQSPPRPPVAAGLSEEERSLLGQLKDRKDAAQAVFMALSRAEQAATAAAQVCAAAHTERGLITIRNRNLLCYYVGL